MATDDVVHGTGPSDRSGKVLPGLLDPAGSPERRQTMVNRKLASAFTRSMAGVAMLLALVAMASAASADPTAARGDITALSGSGTGLVTVSPTAQDHGTFHVQGTIDVHDTTPSTTFTVTRAVDLAPNGICTRNSGPLPTGSLTTSPGGAGVLHFEVQRGAPFTSGTRFNVVFDLSAPDGTLLESECLTVTVK